jgi:hypothetical protein
MASTLDNLKIINRVIAEHRTITESIQLTGGAVNDIQAFISLQKGLSGWAQSSLESLAEKRKSLLGIIESLQISLARHFLFEEEALPGLLGDFLMGSLIQVHTRIKTDLKNITGMLREAEASQKDRQEILLNKADIEQSISNLCATVQEHAGNEDLILGLIKKSLEAEL